MTYQPSTSAYRDYMSSTGTDPLHYRDYVNRPSEYKPNNEPNAYRPYEPMYGDTERQRTVRATPKPNTLTRQYSKPRKDMKLFDCYHLPTGPEYRAGGPMGPEYHVSPYRPVSVKPIVPEQRAYDDPLKQKTGYVGSDVGYYNTYTEYKLTKENNLGMRNWKYDFVDDTVYGGRGESKPRQRYQPLSERNRSPVERKHSPVEQKRRSPEPTASRKKSPEPKRYEERPKTPQYVQPLPVVVPISNPPPTKKKTFKSQPTQTQPVKTKSSSMQTKHQKNVQMAEPLPILVGNGSNRPWSRQTSPNREQHHRSPITEPVQRSPVRSEPVQSSPVKTTPRESPRDMYYDSRRAPSPEIVPLVFAGNPGGQRNTPPATPPRVRESPVPGRSEYEHERRYTPTTHERDIPMTKTYENPIVQEDSQYRSAPQIYYPTAYNPTPYEDLPHYEKRQDIQAARPDYREQPQKSIPNEPVRSRLPPEVTACIEAYNGAHVVRPAHHHGFLMLYDNGGKG